MNPPDDPELDPRQLRHKLNLETGQLGWQELQRHFARGVVVVVGQDLDLIEVAAALSEDDSTRFQNWIETAQVWRATDEDAKRWHDSGAKFWSAVVAPWVLVQQRHDQN